MSTPYERLLATPQAMSEETGIKPTIKDLLVLAPDNDPFRAGTPTDVINGEWFAEVWGDLRQAHLRRAHYAADAQNVPLPGGGVYQNDKESWWDSPASTDSFTLRDVGFSYSILLEVRRALVT